MGRDEGAVRVGNSLGDGEPESEPVGDAPPLAAHLVERLEQLRQRTGGDRRPRVLHCDPRLRSGSPSGDLDPAARHVVPNRVPEQVVDEALDQSWIAGRRSRFELQSHRERSGITGSEKVGDD